MTDFNEWLESGTIKRRAVDLYADAAVMDEMEALAAQIAESEAEEAKARDTGDRAMSDKSALPELTAQAEELMARYEASKSTWHVRALSTDERDEALEAFPDVDAPIMPHRSAPMAVKKAWEKARDEWKVASAKAEMERRLLLLSWAVESIETAQGVIEGVTVDQLRALLKATYGAQRINMLWTAVTEAGKVGEAPIPFSLRDSEPILN